jgi:dinuclear metal center YbgI/SA1388 family protein
VPTIADVVAVLDAHFPPSTAQDWDRVGLVVGDPAAQVATVLFVVDAVPPTVAEAIAIGADLIVAHHPLLLRGVSTVARTTYKGRIVHDLIANGIGLHVAHTNADGAAGGVSEALCRTLGLTDVRPLAPGAPGRIGRLGVPLTLRELTAHVAAALPTTAAGVRAAGDPERLIREIAVSPGAGDEFLDAATAAGVDAYLAADFRHHPASAFVSEDGPALVEAAHWATEWPWLADAARMLAAETGVTTVVSELITDPWTVHAPGAGTVGATTTWRSGAPEVHG